MKYCILLSVFILFLSSCKQEKTADVLSIDFKQDRNDDPSDVLETTFIKLETNDICLIDKTIRQVESTLGKIVVLTGGESKLLIFDPSGKFIALVGSRGIGPGEYILPMSFSIDYHRNRISVVDLAQKKIINYGLTDFMFISEQKMISDSFSFEYLGENKIVWKNEDYKSDYANWNFIVTDMDHNYIDKYVKKKFVTGYSTGRIKNIYRCHNEVMAYTHYDPVVYHFQEDTVIPLYELNFGKYQLPPIDYLEKISANNNNFLFELNQSVYVSNFDIFDIGETFTVCYSVSEIPYIGIYNKRNKQVYNYTRKEFQDKLSIGKIADISGTIDDYIVAMLQPFDLLEKKNENYLFSSKLEDLVAKSSNDDNPILCLFKVKNQ